VLRKLFIFSLNVFLRVFGKNSCQKGASLVEFALVFPSLITIILSTLELGIMLAIKVNLQSCTMAGAYYGSTGAYTTGSTRTASTLAVMTNSISGFLDAANVTFTIQSYASFSVASQGGSGTTGTGSPKNVVMYQANYPYSPSSPLVATFFGTTKTLTSTTYAKNIGTFPS
jgi:Flp pilus assembly protein TadG